MQKAIRNQSGKPVSVENLNKRDEARNKPSANPIVVATNSAKDSAAQARRVADKLDRDREANRIAQAKRETYQGSDNG
jgi:hypothetical protein